MSHSCNEGLEMHKKRGARSKDVVLLIQTYCFFAVLVVVAVVVTSNRFLRSKLLLSCSSIQ